MGSNLYSYDDENRLIYVKIQQGNKIKEVTFAYDPFDRRISQSLERDDFEISLIKPTYPQITNYVYDEQNIIAEYDQNNKQTATYIHGPNIDEPLAAEIRNNRIYYHADGLGSITALTNHMGMTIQKYDYDAFGNIKFTPFPQWIKQPYMFTAREYDHETGLYYYRARYYDPQAGRFITKDPIGFGGGDVNLYSYALNNPINWVDPQGETVSTCCGMTSSLPLPSVMSGLECMSKCLKCTIYISSGWRTRDQNEQAGGAGESYHLRGLAADVHEPPSQTKLRKAATECGFYILQKMYPNRIHVDLRGGATPKSEPNECECKKIREGM